MNKKRLFIVSEELLKMDASLAIVNDPPAPGEELFIPLISELTGCVWTCDWIHIVGCIVDLNNNICPREISEVLAGNVKTNNILMFGNEVDYFNNELYRLVGEDNVNDMEIIAYTMNDPRKPNIKYTTKWQR